MAVTYGFYDSLNHDRLYNAQQMSAIFDGIINDGVFMSVGNQFHTVAGTGMQVIVKSGRAWFDSTWTLNDAEYPLSIDAADVLLTRIDAVVLEVNSEVATRANTIKVVKGTPASTPAKPTLTNTATIHQHALAYVTVAKNTTAITNSMIEIVVGKTETPYVTAILQTTDITDLFKKWENDFQTWFETVKGTLDGDVALNLQNQIDRCVKKADKATSADIEAGTADKWVDAGSLSSNAVKIGCVIQDYTDSLDNDTHYQYITSKQVGLSRSNYPVLFQSIKYKYGCYQTYNKMLTVSSGMGSPPSEAYSFYFVTAFRVIIYNNHVYTYTRIVMSNNDPYCEIIMKDDTVVSVSQEFDSTTRDSHCCVIVYNNRFYILVGNSHNHFVSCKYWDATTEKWSSETKHYNENNDSIRVSEYLGYYLTDQCTIIVKANNNIYCHVVKGTYRCLITVTSSNTISVTALSGNISRMLYDNGTIYGKSSSSNDYYVINPISGEATLVNTTIPNHIYTILGSTTIYPNVRYVNSNATEYIVTHSAEIYSSYLTEGYHVKYINGSPVVKDINLRSYFETNNNYSFLTMFFMMYDLWLTGSSDYSFTPESTQLDKDAIYTSLRHKYKGNHHSRVQALYADPLTEPVKIYLPLTVSYNTKNTNIDVYVYEYDGNFFNISPINTVNHSYMKVQ